MLVSNFNQDISVSKEGARIPSYVIRQNPTDAQ